MKVIDKIPGHLPLDRIDIWFQDEARFGQQNTTTRVWAKKGTRPRCVKQQQFEYVYLFGAVCPQRGIAQAIVVPYVNKEAMRLHLQQISDVTEQDRHAVIIIDGAGWHTEDLATEFNNITLIKLPPYSPELNSIEQVWSWMRQHCLANSSFKHYEDIVDSVCKAWNKFVESSSRISHMCSRDWANMIS